MAKTYTTCVQPQDYQEPDFTFETFVAVMGLLLTATVVGAGPGIVIALFAAMSTLLKICHYLLNGKLVCLGDGREICAVGQVVSFETVDDKSSFEKLDNDYSINILLAPHGFEDAIFKTGTRHDKFFAVADDGIQGDFIKEKPNMPIPREGPNTSNPEGPISARYQGYTSNTFGYKIPYPTSADKPWSVPVLHCEIEGDRIYYVCKALSTLSNPFPFIPGFCDWKPFGIPIGRVVCAAVATFLAPFVLAALVVAWLAGSDDNRDDFNAGELSEGDLILVRGRWVFDSGHAGYNEIHPVVYLQKLESGADFASPSMYTKEVIDELCRLSGQVPPDDADTTIASLTPEQTTAYTNQRKPTNRWIFHPVLDGCEEDDDEDDGPIIH